MTTIVYAGADTWRADMIITQDMWPTAMANQARSLLAAGNELLTKVN